MSKDLAKPPDDLGTRGMALWQALTEQFDFEDHELELLHETCRATDVIDALSRLVTDEGVTQESPQGTRAHPAVVELRQQQQQLARLVAALRIPSGDEDARPQRRGAPRGIYALKEAL